MDVLKLTRKDIFKLRLYDEPIILDATDKPGKWASKEEADHLKELGVIENIGDSWKITHTLKVHTLSKYSDEPHWSTIPEGRILTPKPKNHISS